MIPERRHRNGRTDPGSVTSQIKCDGSRMRRIVSRMPAYSIMILSNTLAWRDTTVRVIIET